MTTMIVDPIPSTAGAYDPDAARRQARERVKRELAASLVAEARRAELVAAIADVEAKKERLADSHSHATAPIQIRLKEIERLQISAIIKRGPANDVLEQERRGLLSQIRELNAALEESIKHEDTLLEVLDKERIETAKQCEACLAENQLIKLGSDEGRIKLMLAQRTLDLAIQRKNAAQEAIDRARRLASFPRNHERLPRSQEVIDGDSLWRNRMRAAELAVSVEAVAVAEQERTAVVKAVLDE